MSNLPLITIVMAAFNEEKLIATAINSIQKQTYANFELIVIDNSSTDRTIEIVNEFISIDKRIRLLTCNIKGPAAARNFGIKAANGKFLAIMDADDYCTPDRFHKLYDVCKKYEQCIVGSNVEIVNAKGSVVRQLIYPQTNTDIRQAFGRLFNRSVIMPGTIMAHTQIFRRFPYNQNFRYLEDWDFILRAAYDKSIIFANVQEFLYKYKLNASSVSFDWKSRNRYNILIWYNQFQRSRGKAEAMNLETFFKTINKNPLLSLIYNALYIAKFCQQRMWIKKTKKLLSIGY